MCYNIVPSSRQLIYTGQVELGDAHRPTAVRMCVQSACTHNLPECLRELGFTYVSYEDKLCADLCVRRGGVDVMVDVMVGWRGLP